MSKLKITVSTWDYDRVRPIMDGRVPIEGCEVNYFPLSPEECFHRAYFNREFEVSEIGFSPYINAVSRGTAPYVGVPVFLSRMFRHSAIYIRSDRGINTPADLKGKKVGVPEFQMTAVLWARGMLQDDHGVSPTDILWRQGGQEQPGRKDKYPLNLPRDFPLEPIGQNETLNQLLAEGKLDAVISARTPVFYRDGKTPVKRMFEDFETVEKDYFRRTGIFPIMHALGIRNDIHEKHPWLAASLYKAYNEAKRISQAEFFHTAALKIGLPWVVSAAQEARALIGDDFWPYGVEANRKTLEPMLRYAHEHGTSLRKVEIAELFAHTTLEQPKT